MMVGVGVGSERRAMRKYGCATGNSWAPDFYDLTGNERTSQ